MLKKVLLGTLSVFMLGTVLAQRVPDSSVTGTARASVGINPAALNPSSDSGIQNAYDPSWTMLIGNPSQTLLPHKFSIEGLNLTFLEGGNVRVDTYQAAYSCVHEYMGGRNGYSRYRCSYQGNTPVSYTIGPAAGRSATSALRFSRKEYSGQQFLDEGESSGQISTQFAIVLGPIINSLGALTGFTFQTRDDDFYYGNYNNPGLTQFPGTGSGPYYFCDPQNSCGGYRGQFPVSN